MDHSPSGGEGLVLTHGSGVGEDVEDGMIQLELLHQSVDIVAEQDVDVIHCLASCGVVIQDNES